MQFGTAIGASDAQSSPYMGCFVPHLTGVAQFLKASKFKLTTDDIGIFIYHVTALLTYLIYHYQAFHNEHLSVANK